MLAAAYRRLTADQTVSEGPTLITGYSLEASADGGVVTLYDGLDALSGAEIQTVTGLNSDNRERDFSIPVLCNNGLFVDVGANVTAFTVYFVPLRGNSPLAAYPGFMLRDVEA
jgi:hypothetical protein